jgi:hypothetical protein
MMLAQGLYIEPDASDALTARRYRCDEVCRVKFAAAFVPRMVPSALVSSPAGGIAARRMLRAAKGMDITELFKSH